MPKQRGRKREAPPLRPARPHNGLLSFISTGAELGQRVLRGMEEDGYVVLPQVLSREECEVELGRLVEVRGGHVARGAPRRA